VDVKFNNTQLEIIKAKNYQTILDNVKANVVCAFITSNHYPVDRSSAEMINSCASLIKIKKNLKEGGYTSTGKFYWLKEKNNVSVLISVGKRFGAVATQVNMNDLKGVLENIAIEMRLAGYKTIVIPLISFKIARFNSEVFFNSLESIFYGMHIVIATHLDHSKRRDGRLYREIPDLCVK